mgnify:CR=1 FL=1
MDISLTPELENKIAASIASGLYSDPSEVVRAGLARLFAADEEKARARERLDAMLQAGIDQLDRGEGIDGEVSRKRMMALYGPRG